MSKVALASLRPSKNVAIIRCLRKTTQLDLSSIVACLRQGKAGIFYTTELFQNDHKAREKELRDIVHCFAQNREDLYILECSVEESWETMVDEEHARLSVTNLLTMLDECADTFQ